MRRFVLLAGAAAMLWVSPLAAQSTVKVHLGSDVTKAGEIARLLMTLGVEGEQVTAIDDEVTFPSVLSYDGVELGAAGTTSSATVDAKVVEEGGGASASHKVHVSVRASGDGVLNAGGLAVIKLKAPAAATMKEDSQDFQVDHKASVTLKGGKKADATGDKGTITVLKEGPEVVACFFYMH